MKTLAILLFLATSANADIGRITEASSGGGFTAGQDVTGDDGVFKTLQSTGTAPSLTATGGVFTGSVTVTGSNNASVGGSLGVGTASPSAKLDVVGDAYFGAAATRSTMTTTGGVLFSGNIGLGVSAGTTPDFPIDMGPTGASAKKIALYSDGGGTGFYGFGLNNTIGAVETWRGDALVLSVGPGLVGINTPAGVAPVAALEVVGGIAHYPRTIAQLLAITPAQVGISYFCSNCSPAKAVISTGTSAGNFASIDGGAFQ